MPVNANCIVPVERITVSENVAEIEAGYEVAKERFIHPRGSDYAKGAYMLRPGKRVSPLDIAIIASCGETDVDVAADPVVRIISTGNELVAAGMPIEAQQIRMSNGPAIQALLESHGYRRNEHTQVRDDIDALREQLALHLKAADVLVLSGGVSMGKADFVPQVLAGLGVECDFSQSQSKAWKTDVVWQRAGESDGVCLAGQPGISTCVLPPIPHSSACQGLRSRRKATRVRSPRDEDRFPDRAHLLSACEIAVECRRTDARDARADQHIG